MTDVGGRVNCYCLYFRCSFTPHPATSSMSHLFLYTTEILLLLVRFYIVRILECRIILRRYTFGKKNYQFIFQLLYNFYGGERWLDCFQFVLFSSSILKFKPSWNQFKYQIGSILSALW